MTYFQTLQAIFSYKECSRDPGTVLKLFPTLKNIGLAFLSVKKALQGAEISIFLLILHFQELGQLLDTCTGQKFACLSLHFLKYLQNG